MSRFLFVQLLSFNLYNSCMVWTCIGTKALNKLRKDSFDFKYGTNFASDS